MALNERKIKRRIRAARNISQITRAMQMVAASKLRRSQERALAGKPYAQEILRLVREARSRVEEKAHPLLIKKGQGQKTFLVLVSTNKGLCGSLNTDLARYVDEWYPRQAAVDFVTLGSKGERFLARTARNLIADFSQEDFLDSVPALSKMAQEGFLNGAWAKCEVVYTEFISALKHKPARFLLLPFTREGLGNTEEIEESENTKGQATPKRQLLVEPSYDLVLETLLPHVIEIQIRRAILEAEASEHAARMIAMKNATDSANDLIEGLSLAYNKVRQEKITAEIADMVTARMAVQ